MFSWANRLAHRRFDVNVPYLRGIVGNAQTSEYYEMKGGVDPNAKILNIRVRANICDKKTNEEIVGYLGERVYHLSTTTRDKDSAVLLQEVKSIIITIEIYCQQIAPTRYPLQLVALNAERETDAILDHLQSLGFY